MKKAWMFVFTTALFVAVGTASLSAHSFHEVRVNIPFGFMVGGKVLPAGAYSVEAVANGDSALVLRSSDGPQGVVFLTFGTYSEKVREKASLVFNRYGDQYLLKEVWMAGYLSGRQLLPSQSEQERGVAMNQEAPEVVTIAAQ